AVVLQIDAPADGHDQKSILRPAVTESPEKSKPSALGGSHGRSRPSTNCRRHSTIRYVSFTPVWASSRLARRRSSTSSSRPTPSATWFPVLAPRVVALPPCPSSSFSDHST